MRINIEDEALLSLTDATKALPPIDGKRPHASTIWRWCRKGVRGVHLEYVRVGNRVCTTSAALSRFVNALAEADRTVEAPRVAPTQPALKVSPSVRQREIQRANETLARDGI
jgi:hypothetical protein